MISKLFLLLFLFVSIQAVIRTGKTVLNNIVPAVRHVANTQVAQASKQGIRSFGSTAVKSSVPAHLPTFSPIARPSVVSRIPSPINQLHKSTPLNLEKAKKVLENTYEKANKLYEEWQNLLTRGLLKNNNYAKMGPYGKNQFLLVEQEFKKEIIKHGSSLITPQNFLIKHVNKIEKGARLVGDAAKNTGVKFRMCVERTANWIQTLPEPYRSWTIKTFIGMAGYHTFDEWWHNIKNSFGDQEEVGFKVLSMAQYVPDVAPDIVFGALAGIVTNNPLFGVVWAAVGGHIEWAMKKAVADAIIYLELPKHIAKAFADNQIKEIKKSNLASEVKLQKIQNIREVSNSEPGEYLNHLWAPMFDKQSDSFFDQILGGGTAKQVWYVSKVVVKEVQKRIKDKLQEGQLKTYFGQEYTRDIINGVLQRQELLEEHGLLKEFGSPKIIDPTIDIFQIKEAEMIVNTLVEIISFPIYQISTKILPLKQRMLEQLKGNGIVMEKPFSRILQDVKTRVDEKTAELIDKLALIMDNPKLSVIEKKKEFYHLKNSLKNQANEKAKVWLPRLEEAFANQFDFFEKIILPEQNVLQATEEKILEEETAFLETDFEVLNEEQEKELKISMAFVSCAAKVKQRSAAMSMNQKKEKRTGQPVAPPLESRQLVDAYPASNILKQVKELQNKQSNQAPPLKGQIITSNRHNIGHSKAKQGLAALSLESHKSIAAHSPHF